MSGPTTAAGRALLEFLAAIRPFLDDEVVLNEASIERIRPHILATEAEAAAPYQRVLLRLHNEQGGGMDKDHSACGIADCAWHESRLLLEAAGLWPAESALLRREVGE